MISTHTEILKYKRAVPVKNQQLTENHFLVINYKETLTKISVLPLIHKYSLKEIEYFIHSFFNHHELLKMAPLFERPFFGLIKPLENLDPELLFIVESVLINVLIKNEEITPPNLNEIKSNVLLNIHDEVSHYKDAQVIKVKIKSFNREILDYLLKCIEINPKVSFRFDSNKFFDLLSFLDFYELLKNSPYHEILKRIDYFEEPLKQFNDFDYLIKLHIPLAFDESAPYFFLHKTQTPKTLVVKPALFGISKTYELIKSTNHHIIISSCFEQDSVMNSLFFLASLLPMNVHGIESMVID